MPQGLRVFKALKEAGFNDAQSFAVAEYVAKSKIHSEVFNAEAILDDLADVGLQEALADVFQEAIRGCYFSERFKTLYSAAQLKTKFVRAGLPAAQAEMILNTMDSCIICSRDSSLRVPIRFQPGPGRVVMCDFTYLAKPEMQKERRAIVISPRSASETGRCTVVPVSMTPPRGPADAFYKFEPGTYPFFHATNPVWAVCDHVYTISLARLWRVNVARKPLIPMLSEEDIESVKDLVGTNLGLHALTKCQQAAKPVALAGG